MNQFKPNTRVRILTNLYDSAQDGVIWKGQLGTVVEADEYYVDVRMDDPIGVQVYFDNIWPFCKSELEIFKEE